MKFTRLVGWTLLIGGLAIIFYSLYTSYFISRLYTYLSEKRFLSEAKGSYFKIR